MKQLTCRFLPPDGAASSDDKNVSSRGFLNEFSLLFNNSNEKFLSRDYSNRSFGTISLGDKSNLKFLLPGIPHQI